MARDMEARPAGIFLLMAILMVQTQSIPWLPDGDEEFNDIDVIFLVDGSSDVSEDDFQLLKHFLVGAVGALDVTSESAHVAIVQMGGPAQVQRFLNCSEHKDQIFSTIKAMKKLGGSRNLGTAFELTRSLVLVASHGSRLQMGSPTVVVSLVTGPPDDDFQRSATILHSLGVRLAVLSVSESNSLVSAASSPTLVRSFSSFQDLQSFVKSFHKFLYQPDDEAEIVFLLDVSAHEDGMKAMQTFVLQMAHRFNLGPVRLGVVMFCEKAEILLPLGIAQSVEDVALKLDGHRLPCEGLTNTGAAIDFTVNSVLAPEKQDVAQSIVLITFNRADDDISGVSELLVRHGVTLFAVGVKDENLSQLMSMVTHGGYYFQLSHAHLLTHLQGKILNLALYDHKVSKVTTLTTFGEN
uniref:cochlin-like n=1 Tax=Myxine glutinosa TaxID=7769 RepID=UPI00358FA906